MSKYNCMDVPEINPGIDSCKNDMFSNEQNTGNAPGTLLERPDEVIVHRGGETSSQSEPGVLSQWERNRSQTGNGMWLGYARQIGPVPKGNRPFCCVVDALTALPVRGPNFPGLLLILSGRGIFPPADPDISPASEYLAEHRRAWRL